jgi:hypothetical protein
VLPRLDNEDQPLFHLLSDWVLERKAVVLLRIVTLARKNLIEQAGKRYGVRGWK